MNETEEIIETEKPFKIYKSYAGLGDKDTPQNIIINIVPGIAKKLDSLGFTVRVAPPPRKEKNIEGIEIIPNEYSKQALLGIDEAFTNLDIDYEIYLPWKNFNDIKSKLFRYDKDPVYLQASMLAKQFNKSFGNLQPAVKAMLIRNVFTIFGLDLKSHIKFMICWTPDGAESPKQFTMKTGFTNSLISMASLLKVPIFNLQKDNAESRIDEYVSRLI